MTITDTTTGESLRVSRTYRTTDGEALLHVTADRRVWLDCTGSSTRGNTSHVGTIAPDEPITRTAARKAANQ